MPRITKKDGLTYSGEEMARIRDLWAEDRAERDRYREALETIAEDRVTSSFLQAREVARAALSREDSR